MKIMAIDPGKANGWACFDGGKLISSGTAEPNELFVILEKTKADHVVYESYRLYASHSRQMIGDDFIAPQVIGVIKYICEKRGIAHSEQPATAKAHFNDGRLKEMGLYVPIDHRRDAIRHGLYYLEFGGGVKHDKR